MVARHLGRTPVLVIAALAVLAAYQAWQAPAESSLSGGATVAGMPRILDGDTLDIAGRRIRLDGIDAPESDQTCRRNGATVRCGAESSAHLGHLAGHGPVHCRLTGRDRYGRSLGICSRDGDDLNATMVRGGHALAYRTYSRRYVSEEEEARSQRRGLWAGDFVAPWDWRRGNR